MLFHSWAFLALLGITLFLFHVVLRGSNPRRREMMLLASYVFYGWWDYRFLVLMLIPTVVNYLAGLRIEEAQQRGDKRTAKFWLLLSIFTNLGILGFFKYFNFFLDSLTPVLSAIGLTPGWLELYIVLPVGISFYTFQSLAYTIDVYRKQAEVCRDPVLFALYVSFFPQLVAGPIERAQHLIPSLERPTPLSAKLVHSGFVLIVIGYFKKLVIADSISPYIETTMSDPASMSAARLLIAIYLFSIQIYADFSGYSDIARGVARLFGIELIRNFDQPYLSRSVTEFWRRWHMSLQTWLFHYLYIPLGGSRVAAHRVYVNIMIVMLLSGLWHGAGWNFVVWGGLNGVFLCLERWSSLRRKAAGIAEPVPTFVGGLLKRFWTYQLICLTWIFFRNHTWEETVAYFTGLATRWTAWSPEETAMGLWLLLYWAMVLIIDISQDRTKVHEFPLLMRPVYGGLVVGAMILAIIYWTDNPGVPFVYFQF